ncbi:paired amphipathic helix protein Sin3-like 3 [Salvia miltiorrhiza]|uniref:paired amphipathic helix protein Sin3-like 3 n=1 Tax=Salvia miltiorrhiza TaxID=226208 RepID=UPI0025AC905A|nr:paired amphipathic helix protein Sin3-like 3 [Salvia miltiorrhiza]
MAPPFTAALNFIREVKSAAAAAGDGGQTYAEFLQTLKQYRKRNLDPSIVISTALTLFRNHPNLLDGFKHFAPAAAAAAAEENSGLEFLNRVRLRSCADFLNRVGARFDGGGAYREFLERMHAYSRGEITAAAVADEVTGIFGKSNGDLVREFARFLPESPDGEGEGSKKKNIEGSRKRKTDWTDDEGIKRRRNSSPVGGAAVNQPKTLPMPPEKHGLRAAEADNDMEDLLCEIDVRIGRLKSARRSVKRLRRRITRGRVSPAGGVRLHEHLTALDLVCIRSVRCRKLLEDAGCDLVPALLVVREALKKKKEVLKRERLKIVEQWNRIRSSSR